MFEQIIEKKKEQVVLVGIDFGTYDAQASMEELASLVDTAGGKVIHRVLQKRNIPDNATYLGTGRLEEVKLFVKENEADLVVIDDELSPAQLRNIEEKLEISVIDRTMLILDIFAQRAHSSEGKIQVELAQLQYMLPRLVGLGKTLSRLAGGIGTRGPGETKLETDRRHIRRRIHALKQELKLVEKRRNQLRKQRKKREVRTIAIVGYTNAGKSTLMNALTKAGVLTEDKLFATLDPTARALHLPNGEEVLFIDTVGLVQRLPHTLVDAFRSTLEEAASADLILNVCDASDPESEEHLNVTTQVLSEIGADKIPVLTVMNKCDRIEQLTKMPTIGPVVYISAKEETGLDTLLEKVITLLPKNRCEVTLLVPFTQGNLMGDVREEGIVHKEEYREEGIYLEATIPNRIVDRLKEYILDIHG